MKVAVVGPVCLDRVIIDGIENYQPGGVTYYVAHALQNLGAEVIVVGSCGADKPDWPDFKSEIHHVPAEDTLLFTNEYSSSAPDMRRQSTNGVPNRISPDDLESIDLHGVDFIVGGPLFHDNLPQETIEALSKLGPLALAVQGLFRHSRESYVFWQHPIEVYRCYPHVSYLIGDEEEINFLGNSNGVRQNARHIQSYGVRNVVVTKASRGSEIYLGNRRYTIPAFQPRPVVDPTGAGDSYLAGLLVATKHFQNPLDQGRFAAMVATMSIENIGPFQGSFSDVMARLKDKQ